MKACSVHACVCRHVGVSQYRVCVMCVCVCVCVLLLKAGDADEHVG